MVGFEDVSKMKYVTVELLRRGWPEKDIRKFWGENFLRVLREVENFTTNQPLIVENVRFPFRFIFVIGWFPRI